MPSAAPRVPRNVLQATLIAALGGLLFGLSMSVIAGAEGPIQRHFSLSALNLGLTVAAALLGTIPGSLFIEWPADRLGRKPTLLLLAVVFLLGSLGAALASDWHTLLAARFLVGMAVGGASVVVPMYIAEISPAEHRGRLVSFNQLHIVLGIFLGFASGWLLVHVFPETTAWRWMLGIVAVPAAVFLSLLFRLPESPRWLARHGRLDAAAGTLERLGIENPRSEIDDIGRSPSSPAERLFQRRFLQPILLAVTLACFNQLSGITALTYAPRIFGMAGAERHFALLQSVALGVTNIILTLVAMRLIDRVGRRKLVLWGSVGYVASLAFVAGALHWHAATAHPASPALVLLGLIAFQASHALGQGAVLWVFISEIFPNAVRARGQSLATVIHWTLAALVGWSFPALAEAWGGGVFALFAAMMVLQFLFAWKIMPETRNRTLEEIESHWEPPVARD